MERKENSLCQNYLNFDLPLGTQVQLTEFTGSVIGLRALEMDRRQLPLNPHREEKRGFVLTSPFVCVTVATATSGYTTVIICLILRLDVGDG